MRARYTPMLSEQDQLIFATLVPHDHYLRQVNAVVDFARYRAPMAACEHASDGRPAADPVVRLKLGVLQTHSNRSDRQVLAATQVNVAFRYFLNLALTATLPHPRLLTGFRARLGEPLYPQLFAGVGAHARAHGLVKDRLRLKDATPVIANIAIPATIRLIAQTRQRLRSTAEPFAAEQGAAERAHALAIRTATTDLSDQERLLARVTHVRQIVTWADQVAADLGPLPAPPPERRTFAAARVKTTTTVYQQIRREHPALERKLAEMVCQPAGRWARYRGRAKNRIQYLLTGLVVNVKRMVRLLLGPAQVAREVCPIDTIAV